jgi:hypothetical protein
MVFCGNTLFTISLIKADDLISMPLEQLTITQLFLIIFLIGLSVDSMY